MSGLVLNVTLGAALQRLRVLGWKDVSQLAQELKEEVLSWAKSASHDPIPGTSPQDTAIYLAKIGVDIANRVHARKSN